MFENLQKRLRSPDSFVSLILGIAVVLVIGTLIYNYFTSRQQQTAQETQEQAQQGLPLTHTVAEGETLWIIAEKYYNSGYNWTDIAQANNLPSADAIVVGQTLTIPEAAPRITSTPQDGEASPAPTAMTEATVAPTTPTPIIGDVSSTSTDTAATGKTYTVVRGDNLWNIAVSQYGNGYRWVEIAQANNLVNPNIIHAGNVLTLP